MNVVMLESGGFIEVQGTAEGAPFSRSGLDELLDLAGKGVGSLLSFKRVKKRRLIHHGSWPMCV